MNAIAVHLRTASEFLDKVTARFGAAILCWTLGLLWLSNLAWKMPPEFGQTATECKGFCSFIQVGVDRPVLPGSAWFLENLVLPNLGVFGWSVLFVEGLLAALLLSGRFLRAASVIGIITSFAIFASVGNSPEEWYWAYILMIVLHVGAIAIIPTRKFQSARFTAIAVGIYALIVAVAHAGAGFTGDGNREWTLFNGTTDVPDEIGRNLFVGSIALALVLGALAALGWILAAKASEKVARTVGLAVVAVATILLFTYSDRNIALGMGSTVTTTVVIAALGLALAVRPRQKTASRLDDKPTPSGDVR